MLFQKHMTPQKYLTHMGPFHKNLEIYSVSFCKFFLYEKEVYMKVSKADVCRLLQRGRHEP